MSKADTLENDLIKFVMLNVTPSWSSNANVFLSLHTADPTDEGAQNSSEAAYTGYSRVTISRSTTALTNSDTGAVVNVSVVSFPLCTAGSALVTHVGLGLSFSGAGVLMYSNSLISPLGVGSGVTPSFNTGSLTITES